MYTPTAPRHTPIVTSSRLLLLAEAYHPQGIRRQPGRRALDVHLDRGAGGSRDKLPWSTGPGPPPRESTVPPDESSPTGTLGQGCLSRVGMRRPECRRRCGLRCMNDSCIRPVGIITDWARRSRGMSVCSYLVRLSNVKFLIHFTLVIHFFPSFSAHLLALAFQNRRLDGAATRGCKTDTPGRGSLICGHATYTG